MINFIKSIFQDRKNITGAVVVLVGLRAAILGVGIADALIVLGCLGLEGFSMYLESKKAKALDPQLMERLSSLESKFNLNNLRK